MTMGSDGLAMFSADISMAWTGLDMSWAGHGLGCVCRRLALAWADRVLGWPWVVLVIGLVALH
jgi:hypothetical protein